MYKLQFSFLILPFILSFCYTKESDCIIKEFSDVSKIVSECKDIKISNLTVPSGEALILNLQNGSVITFEGIVVFEVGYWEGNLIQVSGDNVLVQGAPGHILNAQGEKYWDGQGGDGGVIKPKFFHITTTGGSVFKDIHLLNCAHFCVGITATDLHITGWTVDVSAGNTRGGLNTDGFGVSNSHNILIEDSTVLNQDDCVVVNSGSNMTFRNMQCYGSHGLSFSMGSSSKDVSSGTTNNITFTDSLVANGIYGIHVKTKRGTGLLTDVTYKNIRLSGILEDGIYINQDYGDIGNLSRQFEISDLKISNVYGSVNGEMTRPVHIVCNNNACSNWNWSEINILGGGKSYCNYEPNGFSC